MPQACVLAALLSFFPYVAHAYSYQGPLEFVACSTPSVPDFIGVKGQFTWIPNGKFILGSFRNNKPIISTIDSISTTLTLDIVNGVPSLFINRNIGSNNNKKNHEIIYNDPDIVKLKDRRYGLEVHYRVLFSAYQGWIEMSFGASPFARTVTLPILFGYSAANNPSVNEQVTGGVGWDRKCIMVKKKNLISDINIKYTSRPDLSPFISSRNAGAASAAVSSSLFVMQ